MKTFDGKKKNESVGSSEAAPGHSKSDREFNNLFNLLEIEDVNAGSRRNVAEEAETIVSNEISEEEENAPNHQSKTKKIKFGKRKGKTRKSSKPLKGMIIKKDRDDELESWANEMDAEDEEDELYFMIYCFFKDFNYMQVTLFFRVSLPQGEVWGAFWIVQTV